MRIKASCSSNPMPTNPPHGRGVDSPDDSSVGAGATAPRLPTRFARNAVSNYAFTGVLVVVALVTTPILTHHLGAQEYGVWILVGSVITYAQLLDLGLGGAVVSAVARLSAEGDDDGLERTLNSSFFVLAGLGVVALVLCGVAARFLPSAIHLHQPLAGTTRDLLLLLGVDVAVSIPMDTFGCGLVALQRYDLLNATLIAVAVTQAVAWTIVLVSGGGLLLLGVVTVVISLVGQGIRFVLLRRLLPALSLSAGRVDRALMRSLASPAGWYALGDSLDNFSATKPACFSSAWCRTSPVRVCSPSARSWPPWGPRWGCPSRTPSSRMRPRWWARAIAPSWATRRARGAGCRPVSPSRAVSWWRSWLDPPWWPGSARSSIALPPPW